MLNSTLRLVARQPFQWQSYLHRFGLRIRVTLCKRSRTYFCLLTRNDRSWVTSVICPCPTPMKSETELSMDVNLRILVADAHAGMRGIIVSLLGAEFDVVGAVSGGEQLVRAAMELKPDVIVSDIYMPKLTGIEAQESLQALGINIPFVFVSVNPYFTQKVMKRLGQFVTKEDLVSNLNAAVAQSTVRNSSYTH